MPTRIGGEKTAYKKQEDTGGFIVQTVVGTHPSLFLPLIYLKQSSMGTGYSVSSIVSYTLRAVP